MSKRSNKSQPVNQQQAKDTAQEHIHFTQIDPAQIDFSPFNYRKQFAEQDLKTFSEELLVHGMISPVTVRQVPSGRYELVAGERRVRAAQLAGMPFVPAIIKQLSDDEVIEVQLAENIQRENPHPLHEAQSIRLMQQKHKSIDEIAARLGKSKQYVYARLKLLALIEPFQDMFFAGVITMQQSLDMASVSPDSQQEVFDNCCAEWQKKKVDSNDLEWWLRQCKYNLHNAPFNIKDKKLVPEAGTCSNCPSNTATLKSLFPEFAKEATCTNRTCYQQKCAAHLLSGIMQLLTNHQPQALLFHGEPSETIEQLLAKVPETASLPRYDRYAVSVMQVPQQPDKDDYIDEDDDEIERAFASDLEDYEAEKEEYEAALQSGKYLTGLLVSQRAIEIVLFNPEASTKTSRVQNKVTAKDVQQAIKNGTATPELLQAEIDRIHQREKRALEIDREKVQLNVYKHFNSLVDEAGTQIVSNEQDEVAGRFLVLESLHYSARRNIEEFFQLDEEDMTHEQKYKRVAELTDAEYSFMIRMALAGKPDGKMPNNFTGYCLYQAAAGAGVDVDRYEQEQQQKAATRQSKQAERIKTLTKKIEKLTTKPTPQQDT